MPIDAETQQRILEASQRLSLAEKELHAAMGDLVETDRSSKQMITERLSIALTSVAAARRELERVIGVGAPAADP